jgi:4-hydroxy-tetrahydrodipicolinate reductase
LAAAKLQGTLLYASNFSVGVNLFFALNQQLARLMAPYETYSITLTETHHIHKKDIPSGTAIQLAEDVLSENKRFTSWGLASEQDEAKLKIVAHRKDEVIGTHSIAYVSEIDKIELKHEAFNRTGFAMGAVLATEWIFGRQGVYTMKDMLGLY